MKQKRIIIIDPFCSNAYGHNANSIKYFSYILQKNSYNFIAFVNKDFDLSISKDWVKEPYPCLYNTLYEHEKLYQSKIGNIRKSIESFFEKIGLDNPLCIAIDKWYKVFQDFNINDNDILFMPSTDYYSAMSLLFYIKKYNLKYLKVHFRLINVMEDITLFHQNGTKKLFPFIQNMLQKGFNIQLSTEVKPYADYLQIEIDHFVATIPYPALEIENISKINKKFIISSLGTGRNEKGFFRLKSIIQLFNQTYPECIHKVEFLIQPMPKKDIDFSETYLKDLSNIENVTLLDEHIADETMLQSMQKTSLFLLPYDATAYKIRGSAIYQEALSYKKPVICSSATGFESLVKIYQNGLLATTDIEFSNNIYVIYKNYDNFEQQSNQAFIYYQNDFTAILKEKF